VCVRVCVYVCVRSIGCDSTLLMAVHYCRAALLEEAALMAQFDHPHCVKLIGVVTLGNPLLVRCVCARE
jgi:hypothetical protein